MQWTEEFNALLNQCVFASGYNFEAARNLFIEQASKLRLWTNEVEPTLTASQCQDQWMLLNPTEDDEDDEDNDLSADENQPESHVDRELSRAGDGRNLTDLSTSSSTAERQEEDSTSTSQVGPRLELSLTDAELDQLLSTLPPGPEDSDISTLADSKEPANIHSEMQWVLAFLTNPDAIARVDADAKCMLGSPEKHDDDNYQVFLQGLHEANLVIPEQTTSDLNKVSPETSQQSNRSTTHKEPDADNHESDSDESADEWEMTRQAMKNSMKPR